MTQPEILVVDDEPGIRSVLAEILRDSGYWVTTAADASEALSLVSAGRRFSCVLLDIWMPGMDGLQLLQEWKKRGQLCFPVVMMSGHAAIEQAKQAVESGAMAFLEKPISLRKLLDTIRCAQVKWSNLIASSAASAASRKRGEGLSAQERERLGMPAPKLPVYEIPDLQLRLDFNKPFREALLDFERAYFLTVLKFENLSVAGLSRHSEMERTHLYRKVRSLGLDLEAFRQAAREGRANDSSLFLKDPPKKGGDSAAADAWKPSAEPPAPTIRITKPVGSGSQKSGR